jgi:hypothetical protein
VVQYDYSAVFQYFLLGIVESRMDLVCQLDIPFCCDGADGSSGGNCRFTGGAFQISAIFPSVLQGLVAPGYKPDASNLTIEGFHFTGTIGDISNFYLP